jgi:hypothetical protein
MSLAVMFTRSTDNIELLVSKGIIDRALGVIKKMLTVKGQGPILIDTCLNVLWNALCLSAPDKHTFTALLPLSAPSSSAFPSLLSSAAPAGPRYDLPVIFNVAGPAAGMWPQGIVAQALNKNVPGLELLKATRGQFEGNDASHRIVDRCFALMIHSTMELEFAGPEPGKPEVPADGEEEKGKEKGGKKEEKKKK